MKFIKENLAACLIGALVLVLVLFGTCGNTSYTSELSLADAKLCNTMVETYNLELKTHAAEVVRETKDMNPRITKLSSIVTLAECISKTTVKVNIVTLGEIEVTLEDGTTQVFCGIAKHFVTLEDQNGSIMPIEWSGDEQMNLVPCE